MITGSPGSAKREVVLLTRMRITLRLLLTFYLNFFVATQLITFFCAVIYGLYGMDTLVFLFWFKSATLALTGYFIHLYKKHEYYYYLNLGVSKTILWVITCTSDMMLFGSTLLLVHNVR